MPPIKTYASEAEVAMALSAAHRMECYSLSGKIERLVALLREHGIPLPEEDPRLGTSDGEHLAACVRVVTAAYELIEKADELEEALCQLRKLIGSGMELVGGKSWLTP